MGVALIQIKPVISLALAHSGSLIQIKAAIASPFRLVS
jgi:hypothetical protein